MKSKTRLIFGALCSVPLVMVLGNSMLIPILPLLQQELSLTQFQAGLVITFFSLPSGFIIPVAGYLSDRWGRKRILLPAIIIYGLGGGLSGLAALFLADPFSFILGSRVIQGIGAAGTAQIAMATTGDIFTSRERIKALGYLEAANGIGKVSSPFIGSLTALLIWFAPFFVYPLLSLPSALSIWLLIEKDEKGPGQDSWRSYLQGMVEVFKRKGVGMLINLLTAFLALALLFGTLFYLSQIIEDVYRWQGLKRGAGLSLPVMAITISSIISGTYLKAISLQSLILVGVSTLMVSLVLTFLAHNPVPLLLSTALLGFGLGLILPALNTLITSSVAEEKRGLITSIYASVRFFGTALGPLYFSLIYSHDLLIPVFGSSLIMLGINSFLVYYYLDEERLLPEELKP